MMSAKPQQMTGQNEDPDDLIAELTKLMASDARGTGSSVKADPPLTSPAQAAPSVRIPGATERNSAAPRAGVAAPQSDLVADWQDRPGGATPAGNGRNIAPERREPSFGGNSDASGAAGNAPSQGFEFDFGFNRQRPQGPTSPASQTKVAMPAAASTDIAAAPPSHDLIADLIAAELDQVLPTPANSSRAPAAESRSVTPPPASVRLPPPAPVAPAPNARSTEHLPGRPVPVSVPSAPRPAAEADRFVTAPVFGLGNRPAGEPAAPKAAVDPIDEIESLIGEAVRVELNAPPPAPSFAREAAAPAPAPTAEARPAMPPPAQVGPRRSGVAETVSTPAGSPEEAILAAAAVNGTEVGRVETPYAEARPAARKQRPARERRVAAERRSGGFMRSFVVPVLAGTLLVAIGFGLYWGLGFAGHTGGKAPILTADATPAKTIPPKPVSTAPNSVVMQELSGTTPPASQEALVSRDQTAGATPAQVAAPTPTATKVAAGDSGLANRKVRTVTVRPDGTIVSGDDSVAGGTALPVSRPNVPAVPGVSTAEAAEPAPPATMPGAPTPPTTMAVASTDASPMAAMAAPDANAPLPMARAMRPEGPTVADNTADAVGPAPASAVNAQVNPSPAPRGKPLDLIGSLVNAADSAPTQPAPAQPKTRLASLDAPAPASNAAAHVQLASQPSEAAAETSANVLEQRYGALFNGVRPAVMKADLNGRGVRYRVVIPAASLSNAQQLCSAIKAKGGDCFAYNG